MLLPPASLPPAPPPAAATNLVPDEFIKYEVPPLPPTPPPLPIVIV